MSQLHTSYDAVGNVTRIGACGTGDAGAGVTPDPAAGFRASWKSDHQPGRMFAQEA